MLTESIAKYCMQHHLLHYDGIISVVLEKKKQFFNKKNKKESEADILKISSQVWEIHFGSVGAGGG